MAKSAQNRNKKETFGASLTPEAKELGEGLIAEGAREYIIDDAELERVKNNYPVVDGVTMPVIDGLGDEFLSYVKDGMKITVKPDGVVEVE